jgi:hypothetical protein
MNNNFMSAEHSSGNRTVSTKVAAAPTKKGQKEDTQAGRAVKTERNIGRLRKRWRD